MVGLGTAGVGLAATAPAASATTPTTCGTSGVLTAGSGSTTGEYSCTYPSADPTDTFTAPSGIASVQVTAYGAAGTAGASGGAGGYGGETVATVGVSAGSVYQVDVGVDGGAGGTGTNNGGAGGGASAFLGGTCAATKVCMLNETGTLVVAGGGGGGGGGSMAAAGGAGGGVSGAAGAPASATATAGAGGGGASNSVTPYYGAAGAGSTTGGVSGTAGGSGSAGTGAAGTGGGGGGGAGYYGGGGGGSGTAPSTGGGGGGGTGYLAVGLTGTTTAGENPGEGEVVVAWTVPLTLSPPSGTTLQVPFGYSYSQTISASGGDGVYTYAVTAGALPTGLSLNTSTGVISGEATAAPGQYPVTITATDPYTEATGTASYDFDVTASAPTLEVVDGGRTGVGPIDLTGSAVPGYSVQLYGEAYGQSSYSPVGAPVVASSTGTFAFDGVELSRDTSYYVTVDGVNSAPVEATMTDAVSETVTSGPGFGQVTVRVTTNPAVSGVPVLFESVGSGGALTPLRTLTITAANGALTHVVTTNLAYITVEARVAAGDGTAGGVSAPHAAATMQVSNQLTSGQRLTSGQKLVNTTSGEDLIVQASDGNLVLYQGHRALWSTATDHEPGDFLVMQSDGNLVLYRGHRALWSTRTENHPGDRLVLEGNGSLVVETSTGTTLWTVRR